MKSSVAPIRLQGNLCRIEPLSFEHHDDLVEAASCDGLSNLWYTFVPEPQKMEDNINLRLNLQKEGSMLAFACIDNQSNKAVGMTTYLNMEKEHRRVEIGGTWYSQSIQKTGFNTECKYLLLTHAFEVMHCIAVEFRTHALNHQSRRGIERLGAKLDGVLRNHMIMPNGTLRDTYVYSIICSEWPTIKAHLEFLKNKQYAKC